MSHIGIFGGTFDPIHNGHLITISNVLEQRKLEKIIFVPCYISPLKISQYSISAEHRLAMIKTAIKNHTKFDCSAFEIERGGVSYTIDTLEYFKTLYDSIDLIVGYDNIAVFDKWKNPDKIFSLANVIVMKRKIDTTPLTENMFMQKAVYVDTPVIDISSSIIRERLLKNLPIDFLVPEKVKDYIMSNKLYQPKNL